MVDQIGTCFFVGQSYTFPNEPDWAKRVGAGTEEWLTQETRTLSLELGIPNLFTS